MSNNIEGDFVECGVWRGGQAILAAGILKLMGSDKKVWLYDTFEGFNNIERVSIDYNVDMIDIETHNKQIDVTFHSRNAKNSLNDVRVNFEKAGFMSDNVIFEGTL